METEYEQSKIVVDNPNDYHENDVMIAKAYIRGYETAKHLEGLVKKSVDLGGVRKCVFCDKVPYKEGAAYCDEHMECQDYS
jgi:hypothetical protein